MRDLRPVFALLVPCACALVAAFSCGGGSLPLPEYGNHPVGFPEARCVPWPPPPAKPEETGERPTPRSVWVDGDWIWNAHGASPQSLRGEWSWKPGGWVEPPAGATYARSSVVRLPSGALAWYPGHWHLPSQYERDAGLLDAAQPIASTGVPLECPAPPSPVQPGVVVADGGADGPMDAEPDVRKGPAVLYPPDALPVPEPTVLPDAEIPSDADAKPVLIQPPD